MQRHIVYVKLMRSCFFFQILIVILFSGLLMLNVSEAEICREPLDDALPRLNADLTGESSRIRTYQVLDTLTGDLNLIQTQYRNITRQRIPEHSVTDVDIRANRRRCAYRSTCPWHYVLNTDVNRKPMELVEARCEYQCCNKRNTCSISDSKCKPIMYYIPVLRRSGCRNGVYTYVQVNEALAAGCTCTDEAVANRRMPRN